MLVHIQSKQLSFEQEFAIRALVVALSAQGVGIRDTVNGIEECISEGWLVKRAASGPVVQRVILSENGLKKLFPGKAKG